VAGDTVDATATPLLSLDAVPGHSALFVTTVPITLDAFLVPFAQRFRAKGWRVDALSNGASEYPRIAGSFDSLFDVGWSRNPLDPRNLIGSARTVRRVVREGHYDVVHVHTPIAAFVTRYALKSLSAKERPVVIYTAHGFHFFEGGSGVRNALFRTLERVAAPWSDYIVTVNREDFEAARGLGGINPDRVRLIAGIGVDLERYTRDTLAPDQRSALRASLAVPDEAFMLTMVAEFAPVKRHAHLFRALAAVQNPAVVTVLVGTGPLEAELRDTAEATGISEHIRWAGYRHDVPEVLAASDALVLVSEREGLPRSVLEAMATGIPVIGTRTRGIVDAVGEEGGWLVSKTDPAELAAAIDAASVDRAETARRGQHARERVAAEFAFPQIFDAYEELYREALASRV